VPEAERAEMVAALEMVDYVTIFPELTPLALMEQLRPDIIVKGGDWSPDRIVGREAVASWGGRVVVVGQTAGASTTNFVARVLQVYAPGHCTS
jgi:bifunctional ADP-heptose synthase (sugar kinase/adenylyltransferase)